MRITKHEHAALRVDDHGQTLLIDPGSFTLPLDGLQHLVGVVITHEHPPDHWTPEHLDRILRDAPGTPPVFAPPAGVVRAAGDGYEITEVAPGDTVTAGEFTLRFFGGVHAEIHSSIPPGSRTWACSSTTSCTTPPRLVRGAGGVAVGTLAAPPAGAPWLKIGDAMDFVLAVRPPRRAFGTHDMTLSVIGANMHRARLRWATEQNGGEFFDLNPGGDDLEV